MTEAAGPPSPLIDDLRAVLAGLEHARRRLADGGDIGETDAFWPRLEAFAGQIGTLDQNARDATRPLMLALMDELERTIVAFDAERRDLGDKLRSASRSLAADTAYRQIGMR